jgi:hypothetical protein
MGQKHCSYEPEAYPYSLDGRRGVYVTWGKVED